MRKLKQQNTSTVGRNVPIAVKDGEGSWIKKHWLSMTLLLLVVLTILVRTVFSYGMSAGDNFALSGAGAAEHKHTIESILMGTFGLSDPSLNYPYGGTLIQPPLVDIILAGFAWIITLFGVSVSTASAGVLAFSGPIAAAITVVLVYILGKEMFDRTIGIISALLFATLPLSIVMSVFSNGSGISVVLLFFVVAMLFVVKAIKKIERSERGIKTAFTKNVMKYTIPAGIMFAAIALSWNGFSTIIILLAFMMAAHAILLRMKNRDFGALLGAYTTMILLTILISLPYYVAAGLFTLVFTGPLLLSAISIVGVLIFYALRKKPKIQSFLITIIAIILVFVALYFVSPTLFNDLLLGNPIYETSLIASLLASQSISVSYMATFYGWATVWMPFVIITYMLYRFGKKNHSDSKLMTALWISGLFILSWLSYDNAVMAGVMYAIAAAAVLVTLYRYIEMTSYFQSIKGGGFKASLKKFLKPEPFISLIAVLFLVIAPNAMLLADASTSSNSDNEVSAGYLGGIGYTVDTDDYNPMNMIWDEYSGKDKEGALVTWFQDSSTAVDRGNFTSVTSNSGQGASAASNIILAKGSSGALAAMALRMIMGEGIEKYQNNINIDMAVLTGVQNIINDPAGAKFKVLNNPDVYPGVSADINDENAIYLVAVEYITNELTETEVYDFYDGIRKESDGAIAYIALNAGMIPLIQRDGSNFSTIAYLNDYKLDSNGAAKKYFTYGYNGVNYTDSMFESFLWKSLFGINEAAAVSSNMAMDLVFSDGTLKAQPGLGLTGFDVDCWYVKYNPNDDATLSDDGWALMDAYEAIAKQKTDGGLINYFSSIVMMKVVDSDSIASKSGKITYGTESLEGAKVAVFEKDGNGMFVQRSTSFTDEDGNYSVKVPAVSTDYQIRVYTSTNKTVGGTYVGTITDSNGNYILTPSTIHGIVEGYTNGVTLTAVGTFSGINVDVSLIAGSYTFLNLPSDQYTITAKLGAKTIDTKKFTIYPGDNYGADFELSGELIVTVKDMYGAPVSPSVTVFVESKLNGAIYVMNTTDGVAKFNVMSTVKDIANSGEYIVYVKDKISTSNSVKVSGTAVTKTDLTIYNTAEITGLTGDVIVMAPGYSSSGTAGNVNLPNIGDSTFTLLYDGNVQTFSNDMLSGIEIPIVDFTATLKSASDKPIAGTVTFFGNDVSTEGLTMTYSAGENGIISAMLPEGEYVAYAVGNDGSCSITEVVVADSGTTDLTTDDGRKLTVTLSFSSGVDGSKGLAFRQVQVDVEVETGVTKTIFGMTDSKGKAIITIPDNKAATVSIAAESAGEVTWSAVVNKEVTSGETDVSMSPLTTFVAKPMITGTGTSNTWLLKSLTSTPIELSVPKEVTPGTYFCVEENDPGVYTYSKVNIYAGQTNMFIQPDTKVEALSLVNVETPNGATVTVEADPFNEDAVYYKINLPSSDNYLLESSNSYQFKAVKGDQISYTNYIGDDSDPAPFDLKDKVTLKGYVGVDGDGTVSVTIGTLKLFTGVKDGMYEVDVPAVDDTAVIVVDVNSKPSGAVGECNYTGTTDVELLVASAGTEITKDMQVTGDGGLIAVTDKLTVNVNNVSSTGIGTFKFKLTAKPADDANATKTYAVKAVGPWQLYKAYTVTVVGSTSEDIEVKGIFDHTVIGDGNREMKVSLVDLTGVTKATGEITNGYVIPENLINTVKMMIAGETGASPDAVNDYEYLYAVTIRNDANYLMNAVLTVTGAVPGSFIISDVNGRTMDPMDPMDPKDPFPLAGKADTTLYIKLMKIDNEAIPDITVSANITTTALGMTPDPSGNAVQTLVPKVMELDSSLSIDGNNVYNEGSAPQTAFWVLLLMSVVMIVLVFWLGSKRGVFTRRK